MMAGGCPSWRLPVSLSAPATGIAGRARPGEPGRAILKEGACPGPPGLPAHRDGTQDHPAQSGSILRALDLLARCRSLAL